VRKRRDGEEGEVGGWLVELRGGATLAGGLKGELDRGVYGCRVSARRDTICRETKQ